MTQFHYHLTAIFQNGFTWRSKIVKWGDLKEELCYGAAPELRDLATAKEFNEDDIKALVKQHNPMADITVYGCDSKECSYDQE